MWTWLMAQPILGAAWVRAKLLSSLCLNAHIRQWLLIQLQIHPDLLNHCESQVARSVYATIRWSYLTTPGGRQSKVLKRIKPKVIIRIVFLDIHQDFYQWHVILKLETNPRWLNLTVNIANSNHLNILLSHFDENGSWTFSKIFI